LTVVGLHAEITHRLGYNVLVIKVLVTALGLIVINTARVKVKVKVV